MKGKKGTSVRLSDDGKTFATEIADLAGHSMAEILEEALWESGPALMEKYLRRKAMALQVSEPELKRLLARSIEELKNNERKTRAGRKGRNTKES